jgi:hypothetical protein
VIQVIEYTAPVLVFVDTESDEVVAVRVDNHNVIHPTGQFFDEDWKALTEEQCAEAMNIADSTVWPRWRLDV